MITKLVDFWSKKHIYILSSHTLGKTFKINVCVFNYKMWILLFERLWPTSELNFVESAPELGAEEYDFQLHLKFILLLYVLPKCNQNLFIQ